MISLEVCISKRWLSGSIEDRVVNLHLKGTEKGFKFSPSQNSGTYMLIIRNLGWLLYKFISQYAFSLFFKVQNSLVNSLLLESKIHLQGVSMGRPVHFLRFCQNCFLVYHVNINLKPALNLILPPNLVQRVVCLVVFLFRPAKAFYVSLFSFFFFSPFQSDLTIATFVQVECPVKLLLDIVRKMEIPWPGFSPEPHLTHCIRAIR